MAVWSKRIFRVKYDLVCSSCDRQGNKNLTRGFKCLFGTYGLNGIFGIFDAFGLFGSCGSSGFKRRTDFALKCPFCRGRNAYAPGPPPLANNPVPASSPKSPDQCSGNLAARLSSSPWDAESPGVPAHRVQYSPIYCAVFNCAAAPSKENFTKVLAESLRPFCPDDHKALQGLLCEGRDFFVSG
jgi:hypothetical protein